MPVAFALHFSNLLLSGLLAGCEVGVHYGVGAPPSVVQDIAQIQVRQAAARRLRILMPGLFLLTLVTGVAPLLIGHRGNGRFRIAALLCLAVWNVTRAFVTIRINSAMLDWSPDSPPANWRARIATAQRFHIVGVWAALLAFALFLTSVLSPG